MAELHFTDAAITGMVTTVGRRRLPFDEEAKLMGLEESEARRLKKTIHLEQRYVAEEGVTTLDMCADAATRLMEGLKVDPQTVDGIFLVTQTPDYISPSSAVTLQDKLALPIDAMAFDIALGCSGFVFGLSTAYSYVQSGLNRVLLCVGDLSTKLADPMNRALAPVLGDAGAAIMIERKPSISHFNLYSDGSGHKALYVPNSGVREIAEDEGKPAKLVMDGKAVFNFTLQRVPPLIDRALEMASWDSADVDYFVLHQPNKYMLHNIRKRLNIEEERFPAETVPKFGNQNSASIPGTINGFLSDAYSTKRLKSVMAGFGIGLSWGAVTLETDSIYAPPTFLYGGGHPEVA